MDKPRAGPQSKIRRHGAEEAVNPVLLAGGTLQEGCEAFEKFTGEHIGRSAMWKHNRRLQEAGERTKNIEMLIDRILEHEGYPEGCDPGEKVAALARRMLLTQAVKAVADIPTETMSKLPPDNLAQMISRLEYSSISGEGVGFIPPKKSSSPEKSSSLKKPAEIRKFIEKMMVS